MDREVAEADHAPQPFGQVAIEDPALGEQREDGSGAVRQTEALGSRDVRSEADEPCSALDPIASGVVEDLVASLRGQYTVVIVTHNLAQARRVADHLAVFWVQDGAGTLIEHGPAAGTFEAPRHELTAAYIRGIRG